MMGTRRVVSDGFQEKDEMTHDQVRTDVDDTGTAFVLTWAAEAQAAARSLT